MTKNWKLFAIVSLTLICVFVVEAQVKGWAELIPLQTSRAVVESVIGKPEKYFKTYGVYETDTGTFFVWFSDGKCLRGREGTQWNIKANLLTSLRFVPKEMRPFSEYVPNKDTFIRALDPHSDRVFYTKPGDRRVYDVRLDSDKEVVYSISVSPTKEEESLLCKF